MSEECVGMRDNRPHRNPIGLIVTVLAMVLVLLAPGHATAAAPFSGKPSVVHSYSTETSVVSSHATHKGNTHDHSHDVLAYAPPPPPSVSPTVEHTCLRLPETPTDVERLPEHKPKA
ncbi:hypothetical protein DevBK_19385 [Devosia sp. BK]|uniref:hypothetical protein n=1 Tax=Devosia sp. BK TaxID=2871706 RepID=UPI00293A74A9|nr:hypothetical protein [Devosia sp. BK]MDV3253507.1 hypothetical protein [Devosia sp. BK]